MTFRLRRDSGFTLIEIVLVIVLLGIIAAFAIPRFVEISDETHTAVAQGTHAAFEAAVRLVNNAWQAQGGTGATVQLPGGPINVNSRGFPGHDVPPGFNQADAATVWNDIIQSAPPINGAALTVGADGWWAWGTGRWCFYIYQPDITPVRFIRYDSLTGDVATNF